MGTRTFHLCAQHEGYRSIGMI